MDPVEVKHHPNAHRFEVELGDEVAGLDYSIRDGRMIISHTEVPAQMEGRGIGSSLARAALDHAREQGLRVVPLCSFTAAYVARHAEYQDLLAE